MKPAKNHYCTLLNQKLILTRLPMNIAKRSMTKPSKISNCGKNAVGCAKTTKKCTISMHKQWTVGHSTDLLPRRMSMTI